VNLDIVTLTTAGTAGVAAALGHRPGRFSRHRIAAFADHAQQADNASRSAIWRSVALLLIGVSAAVFFGGFTGVVVGAVLAVALRRWLNSLPAASEVARQRDRQRELPVVVDLLAACLQVGAAPMRAAEAVAAVATSSLGSDLRRIAAALGIGASPEEAWRLAARDLDPVASVMIRSARSGAPASHLLLRVAGDLRASSRVAALAEARRLGVRIAGPLGLCFLPAFLLIGVVPLVISLVQAWT
jgi:pilus assembly protein TadC